MLRYVWQYFCLLLISKLVLIERKAVELLPIVIYYTYLHKYYLMYRWHKNISFNKNFTIFFFRNDFNNLSIITMKAENTVQYTYSIPHQKQPITSIKTLYLNASYLIKFAKRRK